MDDIVPGLLEDMTNDFQSQYDSSSKIKSLKEKLDKGEATYKEANEYAAEVGGITKNVYSEHLTSDNLPDGKCYYNIAERVTSQTLHDQYELVADYSEKVQTDLNKKAGIGLKAQRADENTEEYHSLANYMSSAENYDDVAKSTAQSAERMAKETVDDSVKKNAEFQYNAGLNPKIVRSGGSDCCPWCSDVTGSYDYPKVPKDVYRRHNNCTCTVEYNPGTGKRQDVWSKKWMSAEEVEKRENLKTLGLDDTNKSDKIEQRKTVGLEEKVKIRTVEQADEALRKMFGTLSSNIRDIDEKLYIENANQLQLLNDKFKAIPINNSGLFTADPDSVHRAWTCGNFVTGNDIQLCLPSNWYDDYDLFLSTEKYFVESFYNMPCSDEKISVYTVTHEYGHILEQYLSRKRIDWKSFKSKYEAIKVYDYEKAIKFADIEERKQAEIILNEIVNIAKEENASFLLDDYISRSAYNDCYEVFAEAFANSQCGQPNELGRAMNKWLIKEGF